MSEVATERTLPAVIPLFLSCTRVTLPDALAGTTDCLPPLQNTWLEKLLCHLGRDGTADRVTGFRGALRLFRKASRYSGIVTCGDFEGLTFAMLQRLTGSRRPVHVMFDCLWYGGGYLKRKWMQYCLQEVDRCVVWASIEVGRYADAYGTEQGKFLFVPHHHTTRQYRFDIGDDGYVFTGGNWSRDYKFFVDSVRDLTYPCIIATTRAEELLAGITVPSHVRIVSASHEQFRQLIARSSIVVLPMQADQLHAGGQQTFLNAMLMGKPVILTDPQGGRDYIQDGVNGRLIAYGDKTQLKDAINCLMGDVAVRREMGEAAKRVAMPLTTEACNARIWQELQRLILMRNKAETGEVRRRP